MAIKTSTFKGLVLPPDGNLNLSMNSEGNVIPPVSLKTFSSINAPATTKTVLPQSKNKCNDLFLSNIKPIDTPQTTLSTFVTSTKTFTSINLSSGTTSAFTNKVNSKIFTNELILSSGSYDDKIQNTVAIFSTNKDNASELAITTKFLNHFYITTPPIEDLKSILANTAEKKVFSTAKKSLYEVKEVNLRVQSLLNHTFIVLDETFDNIIGKSSMDIGTFIRAIQTNSTKVHVVAVPNDESKNIICKRNVSLPIT